MCSKQHAAVEFSVLHVSNFELLQTVLFSYLSETSMQIGALCSSLRSIRSTRTINFFNHVLILEKIERSLRASMIRVTNELVSSIFEKNVWNTFPHLIIV